MKKTFLFLIILICLCSCAKPQVNSGANSNESFIACYGDSQKINNDTFFIGDSITVGLYNAADLGGARVLAKVGINTIQMKELILNDYSDIVDDNIKKVIINLGTNDASYNTNDSYRGIIDFIKEKSPKAQVYICLIHYPNENSIYSQTNTKSVTDKKNKQLTELKDYCGAKLIKILQKAPFNKTLTDSSMTVSDGLHLTDDTYRNFCAELMANHIIK